MFNRFKMFFSKTIIVTETILTPQVHKKFIQELFIRKLKIKQSKKDRFSLGTNKAPMCRSMVIIRTEGSSYYKTPNSYISK